MINDRITWHLKKNSKLPFSFDLRTNSAKTQNHQMANGNKNDFYAMTIAID